VARDLRPDLVGHVHPLTVAMPAERRYWTLSVCGRHVAPCRPPCRVCHPRRAICSVSIESIP
jgi:hypothetical protein